MRSFKREVFERNQPDHALASRLRRLGEVWVAGDGLEFDLKRVVGDGWRVTGDGLRGGLVSAEAAPDALRILHDRFERAMSDGDVDPILLAATYLLDFLCIAPFERDVFWDVAPLVMGRIGYRVEFNAEDYRGPLAASSIGWVKSEHDLLPWWHFFTAVMLRNARQRDVVSKQELVRAAIERAARRFSHAEIALACPTVSRPTIELVLAEMRTAGTIKRIGAGRATQWEKLENLKTQKLENSKT